MNNCSNESSKEGGRHSATSTAGLVSIFKETATQLNQHSVQEFIEITLEEKLPGDDLYAVLKDGVVLCRMINKLRPGTIPRISKRPLPFLQMENISNFLEAAKSQFGIKSTDLFQTVDLFEGKDLQRVHLTILSLARASSGYTVKQHLPQTREEDVIIEPPMIVTKTVSPHSSLRNLRKPSIGNLGKINGFGSSSGIGNFSGSSPNLASSSVASPATTFPSQMKDNIQSGRYQSKATTGATPTDFAHVSLNGRASPVAPLNENLNEILTLMDGDQHVQYQLGSCIGRGQFGAVYKALNLETGHVVAVKRIPLMDQDQDGVEDLMKEVELLKSLSHPNIVRYEGFLCDPKTLNIVLEFVEAGSLSSILKQFGKMPEKLCVNYVVKMLEGLEYLHGQGVVHCDLKCANILTTKNGETKLSDFGVSKQLNVLDKNTQAVVGTPNWMAPEVIELSGASIKSDIWSLACTIVEMLTGRPPYWDMNPMTALFRIVEDDNPPLPEGISPELKAFLMKCFQKDIANRADATELLQHEWIRRGVKHGDRSSFNSILNSPVSSRQQSINPILMDTTHNSHQAPSTYTKRPNSLKPDGTETNSSITQQTSQLLASVSGPGSFRASSAITPHSAHQNLPDLVNSYRASPSDRSPLAELHVDGSGSAGHRSVSAAGLLNSPLSTASPSDNKVALDNVARSLVPNREVHKSRNVSSLAMHSNNRNNFDEAAESGTNSSKRHVAETLSDDKKRASRLPPPKPRHGRIYGSGASEGENQASSDPTSFLTASPERLTLLPGCALSQFPPPSPSLPTAPILLNKPINAVGTQKPAVPPSPFRTQHQRGLYSSSTSSSPEKPFLSTIETTTALSKHVRATSNASIPSPASATLAVDVSRDTRVGPNGYITTATIVSKSPAAMNDAVKRPDRAPHQIAKGQSFKINAKAAKEEDEEISLTSDIATRLRKELGTVRANMEIAMLLAATASAFEVSSSTNASTTVKGAQPSVSPIPFTPVLAPLLKSKSKSITNIKSVDLIRSANNSSLSGSTEKKSENSSTAPHLYSRAKSSDELISGKSKSRRGSLPQDNTLDSTKRAESVPHLRRASTSGNEKNKPRFRAKEEFERNAASGAYFEAAAKGKHAKHLKVASSAGNKGEKDCLVM
ncbi:hypothetical protein SeMB42_g06841 [Synchytrium endobioticum]|nr:hypothetical protein SeMB42_g06841 [Synchytrium endobioticum]